ncbi:hypothetical protein [Chitinophaga sancti]|uniref:Uncharacterized protein n=1 Tax=Chitinophaga sancti TaxID=1004 RepID=A0A1K1S4W0_9BACT|nr:hypothetical protein [Chitinophaga sancti]WQD63715.1 hypothetical protein U0033_04850 [Chitinophaga sancti]WQG90660.1 hypothetical protein SR876_04070 [Chitinophaga sancti]SFW79234.1 hypothetical protein SAMN05661012_04749 [Chitinophaga sancti]
MEPGKLILPGESFYPLIMELFEKKEKAAILYDDNGPTRAGGIIESVFEKEGTHWLRLEDGTEIQVDKLQAVNGNFSSDFSTC